MSPCATDMGAEAHGNHVKKLFWCFFGAEFYGYSLIKDGLESMQAFAQQVHANRMIGLYVEQTEDGVSVLAETIDVRESESLIELADARLEIGRATSELQSLMRISYAAFCLK